MTSYVLDTHTIVWYVARPRALGRAATRVLRNVDRGRSAGWIPAIVVAEVALLRERGRTTLGVADLEATVDRNSALRILPLDLMQVREFAGLVGLKDPFDRFIVAAARTLRCPLITADENIARTGLVEVIWD